MFAASPVLQAADVPLNNSWNIYELKDWRSVLAGTYGMTAKSGSELWANNNSAATYDQVEPLCGLIFNVSTSTDVGVGDNGFIRLNVNEDVKVPVLAGQTVTFMVYCGNSNKSNYKIYGYDLGGNRTTLSEGADTDFNNGNSSVESPVAATVVAQTDGYVQLVADKYLVWLRQIIAGGVAEPSLALTVDGIDRTDGTVVNRGGSTDVSITAADGYHVWYRWDTQAHTPLEVAADATRTTASQATASYAGTNDPEVLTAIAVRSSGTTNFLSEARTVTLDYIAPLEAADHFFGVTRDYPISDLTRQMITSHPALLDYLESHSGDGGNYRVKIPVAEQPFDDIDAVSGLRFTSSGGLRFVYGSAGPAIRAFAGDRVHVPVLAGMTVTFTLHTDGSHSCGYTLSDASGTLDTGTLRSAHNHDSPEQVTVTATQDGYVTLAPDNTSGIYVAGISTDMDTGFAVRARSVTYTESAQFTHHGLGVDIDLLPVTGWTPWYKWGGRAYTADELPTSNPTVNQSHTAYTGTNAERYLTGMQVTECAANGVTYHSDPIVLTLLYEQPPLDENHPLYSGTLDWIPQNGDIIQDGDTYVNKSSSGDRSMYTTWNGLVDLSSRPYYGITFKAAFDANTENRTHELALVTTTGDALKANGSAWSDYIFKLAATYTDNYDGRRSWQLLLNGDRGTYKLEPGVYYDFEFLFDKVNNRISYSIKDGDGNILTALDGSTTATGVQSMTFATPLSLRMVLARNNNKTFKFKDFLIATIEPELSFSHKSAMVNLIDLYFEEPSLYVDPAGGNVTFTSSNESVARATKTGATTHDLMLRNGGKATITATLDGYDDVADSYEVTVVAPDATYSVEGNTYTLTGEGKLAEREVTMVKGVTMQFGAIDGAATAEADRLYNITIVRNEADGLVATTLDNQGWRYMRPTRNADETAVTDAVPVQGTFYKFVPTMSGRLTVTGARASGSRTVNPSPVVLMAIDGQGTRTVTTLISADGMQSAGADLRAGYTYYLYAQVPDDANADDGWSMFQLHSFTYEANFRYAAPSSRKTADQINATGYRPELSVTDLTGVTFACKVKGNLTVDFDATTGTITHVAAKDGELGGAIIVTATTSEDGGITTYATTHVVTVPYATHKWDFTRVDRGGMEQLRDDTDEWAVTYKVRLYEDESRMLYYLNKAVLSNNLAVDGDNAIYIDETAGLIFNGLAKNFGTNVEPIEEVTPLDRLNAAVEQGTIAVDTEQYTIALDAALEAMLAYRKDEVQAPAEISTGWQNTVTIPDLRQGQCVIMRVNRHSGGKGEHITVSNLADLDGHDLSEPIDDKPFGFTGIITNNNNEPLHGVVRGAYVFRVIADGDVTFRVNDENGWLDIYDIEVTEAGHYDTEMTLLDGDGHAVSLENNNYSMAHVGPVTPADPVPVTVMCGGVNSLAPRATAVTFTIEPDEGITVEPTQVTLPYTTQRDDMGFKFTFAVTSATKPGNIKVVQRVHDSSGNFTANLEETYFALGLVTPQQYPLTWEFADRNMSRSTSAYTALPQVQSQFEAVIDDGGATDDTKQYGAWNTTAGTGDAPDTHTQATVARVVDGGLAAKVKPLFARGAELTAGSTAFAEAIGLGIAVPMSDDATTGVVLDGHTLCFPAGGTVTVPAVQAGQRVYVQMADGQPQPTVGGSVEATTGGGYLATADGDISLAMPEQAQLVRLAVTDIVKDINRYGFATESRERAIDHTLTGEFTDNDVNAYIIATYDTGNSLATLTPIDVVDAENGIVLFKQGTTAEFTAPLFVPACNIPADAATGNLLRPNVERNTAFKGVENGNANFTLTNIAYHATDLATAVDNADANVGYYMAVDGTLDDHKSYLQLTPDQVNGDAGGVVFINQLTSSGYAYTHAQVLADTDHGLACNNRVNTTGVSPVTNNSGMVTGMEYATTLEHVHNTIHADDFKFSFTIGQMEQNDIWWRNEEGLAVKGYAADFTITLPDRVEGSATPQTAADGELPVSHGADTYVYFVRVWRNAPGDGEELLNAREQVADPGGAWGASYAELATFMPARTRIHVRDVFVGATYQESKTVDYTVRMYAFEDAIVTRPEVSFAPRRVAIGDLEPDTSPQLAEDGFGYDITEGTFSVTFNNSIVTAIDDPESDDVTGVTYTDALGRTASRPFSGLNIVTVKHADGSTSTHKIIR